MLLKHKVQTATILAFQYLALSDTVLLVLSVFVYTWPVLGGYIDSVGIMDEYFYIIRYLWPFGMMAHTCTVWLTVVVTLHRFVCICKPHGLYVRYNNKIIRIQIMVVVSFSVLFNIPRFFEHFPIQYEYACNISTAALNNATQFRTNLTQTVNLGDNFFYQLIYSNIIYFPVMYIVPLVSLIYLSYRLTRAVHGLQQRKTTVYVVRQAPTDHVTWCIIVIVLVFITCQTPALVNQIFWTVLPHSERECGKFHFYYTKVCDLLVILNSSVNFIIFCLFGKSFRKIFIEVLSNNRCMSLVRHFKFVHKTVDGDEVPVQMV